MTLSTLREKLGLRLRVAVDRGHPRGLHVAHLRRGGRRGDRRVEHRDVASRVLLALVERRPTRPCTCPSRPPGRGSSFTASPTALDDVRRHQLDRGAERGRRHRVGGLALRGGRLLEEPLGERRVEEVRRRLRDDRVAVAAAEERDGRVRRDLVYASRYAFTIFGSLGKCVSSVARTVRFESLSALLERLDDRVAARGARDVRERLGDARDVRLAPGTSRRAPASSGSVPLSAAMRTGSASFGMRVSARRTGKMRSALLGVISTFTSGFTPGVNFSSPMRRRRGELPELDLVHALRRILRIGHGRGELLDRLGAVGLVLHDHDGVLEVLHEVDRLRVLRRLELREAVPERVDEALIGELARLREARSCPAPRTSRRRRSCRARSP